MYRPLGRRPVEVALATFVDTPATWLNDVKTESAASGSSAPRLTAPPVSVRINSRYVVASVERVHRILTEFESGVSGNTYERVGFKVPIFQELPPLGELKIGD